MLDIIAGHSRSLRRKLWSDRIDIDGLAHFLRGQHPDKTAEHVADRIGTPADTVRKWLAGRATPNGIAAFALMCAYGPELLHAAVTDAPEWLSAAVRAERMAALERDIESQRAELAKMREEA